MTTQISSLPWIIGITGASGTVYARRLVHALVAQVPNVQLEVVVSEAALRVMHEEENVKSSVRSISAESLIGAPSPNVTFHNNRNIGAPIASGSYQTAGMVVVPCSMTTLAGIACGFSDNLIRRAADVVMKEGRKLILVPRETPLSTIHLENMLKLSRMGVQIVPAMPGFYLQPASVSDIVDLMVMKIADSMGFHLNLTARWGEKDEKKVVHDG